MNVYSIDVKIIATAYIKAANEEEARRIFAENFDKLNGGELPTDDGTGSEYSVSVSGRSYDDWQLPEASLSPAITFYGPAAEDGSIVLDLVDEGVGESEET